MLSTTLFQMYKLKGKSRNPGLKQLKTEDPGYNFADCKTAKIDFVDKNNNDNKSKVFQFSAKPEQLATAPKANDKGRGRGKGNPRGRGRGRGDRPFRGRPQTGPQRPGLTQGFQQQWVPCHPAEVQQPWDCGMNPSNEFQQNVGQRFHENVNYCDFGTGNNLPCSRGRGRGLRGAHQGPGVWNNGIHPDYAYQGECWDRNNGNRNNEVFHTDDPYFY